MRTIDIHSHVLTEETMALIGKEVAALKPWLTRIDADNFAMEVAGTSYRPFPLGGFELERRFADMAASEVDMQVISATPQTYFYEQEPAAAAACAVVQNEGIAKLVKAHPDRFIGIATLPLQDGGLAAKELTRALRTLGLRGAMIGSNANGTNLDHPSYEPLWAAAAELGAFMLIHPTNVAGAGRLMQSHRP